MLSSHLFACAAESKVAPHMFLRLRTRVYPALTTGMDCSSSSGERMNYARISLPAPPSRGSGGSGTCVTARHEEQCCGWYRTAASVLKISAATAPN